MFSMHQQAVVTPLTLLASGWHLAALPSAPTQALDCKEIKRVNLKGNQPSIFIGRTGAEAPVVWPPDAKGKLNGKDPDAGKD